MVVVCLLLTACDADKILPGGPMVWSYEIFTPENVKWIGSAGGWVSQYHFKANSKEGDMVMTCDNFDVLDPISGNSYIYDCEWVTLKIEGNQVKIHFPPSVSDAPDAYEEIRISAMMEREKLVQSSVCPELLKKKTNQIPSQRLCRKKLSSG